MSELSRQERQRPVDMSLQDMEKYIKAIGANTLEKPKKIDRDQWVRTYDPRGCARKESEKLRKKGVKNEVFLQTRKGTEVEVSGHFHTQCGLTSGNPSKTNSKTGRTTCARRCVSVSVL